MMAAPNETPEEKNPWLAPMRTNSPAPTIADVERIKNIKDPVIRNLQITQCYHELAGVMAKPTGLAANWCTFATWASKQAGQTIRKEDLARLLEHLLNQSPSAVQASESVAAAINVQRGSQFLSPRDFALRAEHFQPAIDRASQAVGRGNKKVFEEIGYTFARFYQDCFPEGEDLDHQALTRFCEDLRPGDPPDGQGYLRQAFQHYSQALQETDPKQRAEWMLLANLEIGFHEQTRLQPEIAESMDAAWMSFLDFARHLFRSIFPLKGWLHLVYLYLRRLLRRPSDLDLAMQALLSEVRLQLRRAITEVLMTITIPPETVLRLGEDLPAGFPDSLKQIDCPDLARFLQAHDLTPDSTGGSGAADWAELPDRLHFIIDLFRCYQEQQNLFEAPYTPEQVEALKNGRRPEGRL